MSGGDDSAYPNPDINDQQSNPFYGQPPSSPGYDETDTNPYDGSSYPPPPPTDEYYRSAQDSAKTSQRRRRG